MASNLKHEISNGENTKHRFWLRSIKLVNAILITIPFAFVWFNYYIMQLNMQINAMTENCRDMSVSESRRAV